MSLGKKFENVIFDCFSKVPDVSIDRIHDQTTGFLGSTNICDFLVYKKPYQYYIECKTTNGNRLPFANITKNQWQGLLRKSTINGVQAGIICWWYEKDVTRFIPISFLEAYKTGHTEASIRYDNPEFLRTAVAPQIMGRKKRMFFDYDMEQFFRDVNYGRI